MSRKGFDERQSIVLSALQAFEDEGLASVIYPHEFLCNEATCTVFKDGQILYLDDDHLSIEGARPIVNALKAYFDQMETNAQKAD